MNTIMIIVALYLVVIFAIGYWAMKKTKTSADFFIAGKSLGMFVSAIAIFSTSLSGFLFIGGPGLTYELGMGALWFTFPTTISFAMAWYILGKRMRLMTEATGAMTVADAVYHRYNSRVASGLTGVATLVGIVVFLGTQVLALGTIIAFIFDISVSVGVVIGMFIVALYSAAGGIMAGTYTSVFQGSIMAVASLVIFFISLNVGDGLTNITQTIATQPFTDMGQAMPEFVGPWGLATPILAMSWFFALSIGIVGQPHVVSRLYMIQDVSKLKWGPALAAVPAVLGGLLLIGVGLVMRYLVITGEMAPLANPDDAILVFLVEYTPAILAGIVFAGVASAIMSTCDAFINIASAAMVRDIPFALNRTLSDEKQLKFGRFAVVVISIVTVLAVLSLGDRGIALLGAVGWGTFAAALAPVLGIGLNWKKATKEGAIASILVGLVLSVVIEVLATLGIYTLPHGIYTGAIAMVISIMTFIAVSYVTKPQPLPENIERVMDA
ncbi:sodium:solute symporter family transporter [Shouchella shacheensis]|uniref:sodium:solute symporter family transporter n=1 Tax=Shouchella shacheensis TaxID=1649580 RepID=UPI00073FB4BC|nr:hypothetical protein [Shouchella shacheensis]